MKYIIYSTGSNPFPMPLLFPDEAGHDDVGWGINQQDGTIHSAGFVSLGDTTKTYGKSVSLGVQSKPEDAELIDAFVKGDTERFKKASYSRRRS